MTRGQKLYNKTYTLPNWEGFFICSETSSRLKKL
nr:MAG TPA: hypothetical protein [Caudoviricetes sp.]